MKNYFTTATETACKGQEMIAEVKKYLQADEMGKAWSRVAMFNILASVAGIQVKATEAMTKMGIVAFTELANKLVLATITANGEEFPDQLEAYTEELHNRAA